MIKLQRHELSCVESTMNTYRHTETTENIVGQTDHIFQLRTTVGRKENKIQVSNLDIVESTTGEKRVIDRE